MDEPAGNTAVVGGGYRRELPALRLAAFPRRQRLPAGIGYELEHNNPAPGWTYRRLLIRTPSGYRLGLEGPAG